MTNPFLSRTFMCVAFFPETIVLRMASSYRLGPGVMSIIIFFSERSFTPSCVLSAFLLGLTRV